MSNTVSRQSFDSIPRCFASCSIGETQDSLPSRLHALSTAGFTQIELSFPDLQSFATKHLNKEVQEDDYDSLCEAGQEVRRICQQENLDIFILQPFANFEGWEEGSRERQDAFRRAKGWIRIMKSVGTDMLQVGSSDSEGIDTDRKTVVQDLALLADLLAAEGFKLAYENWCWGHASTWRDVYNIVSDLRAQGKSNVGLCLDSFQTAGSEWADPTSKTGLNGDSERDANFERSMHELATTVPADLIYFYQVSDAYRLKEPMQDKIIDGLRARGRWSHDWRPLPYQGGYLPVVRVTKAILDTGFCGTFSVEVFDRERRGTDHVEYAQQAKDSLERLLSECSKA
ncbi:sugar phosphate isomerase/epimerase family protein [Sporobolomyces koalae]|uniref:sugar phosphate isomerase/epimerase family protein n=1 Tax=Sporobolomyces koalae TaxID=500713 RepID=UPI00316ED809